MELERWARQSCLAPLHDLTPLGEMIGNAPLVGLTEGVHGAAEPLEFRNRLFQFLVSEMGFTAIALESGLEESRIVQEYVTDGRGELSSVLKSGITWGFGELPQNAELIRWMQDYNATVAPARKVSFYGFDLSAAHVEELMKRRGISGAQTSPAEIYEVSDEHSKALDERDRAQADHIHWIVEREGSSGKILIFAARYHLSATPVMVSYSRRNRETLQHPAGVYLRQRYGDRLVTLCNLVGGGEVAIGGYRENLGRAPVGSIDGIAARLGEPLFALDLRDAPEAVAQELRRGCELSAGCQTLTLPLPDAFDILLYIDKVTPACG